MRLLVLGGTRFVGRALVADAVDRGWDVTVVNRGLSGAPPAGVRALTADRTDREELGAALRGQEFDLTVDTWAGAPRVVRTAAQLLTGRVGRFGYVSSMSVYTGSKPAGADETWPTVEATADADSTDYATDKRGGELAVLESFPDALLGRSGFILGPYDDTGRLAWWLVRAARGGWMVAPGRPGRPMQLVDARDLATWFLDALPSGAAGAHNTSSPSGSMTTADLLASVVAVTGGHAELVWVPEQVLAEHGVDPWRQLPGWLPESGEDGGLLEADTSRAARAGLRTRPVDDTVQQTWQWLQGQERQLPPEGGYITGLSEDLEQSLLAAV